ncbi:hypothetical protein DSM112329_05075 [Paraconexibacter sp. AEG42_29]|uniref:Siderophore synthetase component n=1 Tax=Paraconexibacter sp. AEG42_29 TaxID=2997339 RepID=A0AAU7B3D2_9ACTN
MRESIVTAAGAPPAGRARAAATAAATSALVNCHIRETGDWQFVPRAGDDAAPQTAVLTLAQRPGTRLQVGVARRTPTDRCLLAGPPILVGDDGDVVDDELSVEALADLLLGHLQAGDPRGDGAPEVLLERIRDSIAQTAHHLELRATDGGLDDLYDGRTLPFIDSEQGLLVGHPLHPTAKSRVELSADERDVYSPETRGRFALHWLAVVPSLVHHGSGEREDAPTLVGRLLHGDPAVDEHELRAALTGLGPRILIPAHPWQLAHLGADPSVAALLADDDIVDLGPLGAPVTPTSSVRTVYREDWGWQLKFSLDVRVTNSLRVTLPKELTRAAEAAHLEAFTRVGAAARAAAPRLRVVHDPAFLAVRAGVGEPLIDSLSVLLRANSFAGERPICLASLCERHPFGGRSRLGNVVGRIAATRGRTEADVATEWIRRYCDVVVRSLVRLYLDVGLCFEPHQQNTLLQLDRHGWPDRCLIRDSQGYFHREAAHADLTRVVPGLGEASESIFPEALADERLVYYPFLNAAVGTIDTLVLDGCADGPELLAVLRDTLADERRQGGRYPHTLLDRLLDDERWPCKGNLRTRLHDMDELVGDIATQSVYGTIPNPLRRAAA